MTREETYLGDGLYASFDGYQIWLRAPLGSGVEHKVALEPPVFAALVKYEKGLREKAAAQSERLQKYCPDCYGTGRVDFGDDVLATCDLCGGEGTLP